MDHRSDKNYKRTRNILTAEWNILAQTLATWVPYSKAEHTISFFRWLFFTLAATGDTSGTEDLERILVQPNKCLIPLSIFREEKSVAISLLNDASFFEVSQAFEKCTAVLLTCVVELITLGVSDLFDEKLPLDFEVTTLLIPPLDHSWKLLTSKELTAVLIGMKNPTIFASSTLKSTEMLPKTSYLERSLRLLMILNGISEQSLAYSEVKILVDTNLRLHAVMQLVLGFCSYASSDLLMCYVL